MPHYAGGVSELLHLCREFAAFVEREPSPGADGSRSDLRDLQLLTLRLAVCATAPTRSREWTFESAPELSDERWDRRQIGARFPQLGMYWDLLGRDLGSNSRTGVGDAIDDVESLYSDARDALDERETEGAEEAESNFRFSWRIHTGKHATALIDLLPELRADDARE